MTIIAIIDSVKFSLRRNVDPDGSFWLIPATVSMTDHPAAKGPAPREGAASSKGDIQ